MVNGFSSSDAVTYSGTSSMQGLILTEITQVPSSAPSEPAAAKSSNGSATLSEGSSAVIVTVVVIVVACLIACAYLYVSRRKERLQFIRSHPSEEDIAVGNRAGLCFGAIRRTLRLCCRLCFFCSNNNGFDRAGDDASSDGGGGPEGTNRIRLRPLWQQHSNMTSSEEDDRNKNNSGYEANVDDLIVFVDESRTDSSPKLV